MCETHDFLTIHSLNIINTVGSDVCMIFVHRYCLYIHPQDMVGLDLKRTETKQIYVSNMESI